MSESAKDDTLDLDRANLAVLRQLAAPPPWGRMRA
jgi:hypothetical protein